MPSSISLYYGMNDTRLDGVRAVALSVAPVANSHNQLTLKVSKRFQLSQLLLCVGLG